MNTTKAVKIEKGEDGLFHIRFEDGTLSVKGYKTQAIAASRYVRHNDGGPFVK